MEHYDWNDGWLFTPVFDPAIVRPECPELTLEPVRLPHTVKALPYNYCNENDYQKLSGYRREFFAPKEWEGRTVLLTFGAVAHDATVFCNGRRVFHHSCGYTAFTVDLTSALHLGQKNVVAVRCDSREDLNIPPFGGQMDFLTYGGICRAVCLDVKEPAYLRDIFIETKAEGDFRIYTATVGETVGCTLQAEIRSPSGSRAFYTGELSLPITGALNSVHPWSIEHPTLYTRPSGSSVPAPAACPTGSWTRKAAGSASAPCSSWRAGSTSTASGWSCGASTAARATPIRAMPCPTASSVWTLSS